MKIYRIIITIFIFIVLQSCEQDLAHKLNEESVNCKNDTLAIDLLNKAISIDSNSSILYCNRAWRKLKLNDLFGTISDCKKAIELKKNNPEAYSLLGRAYHSLERFNLAIDNFTVSLNMDTNNFSNLYYRGISYYMLDSNQLAILDFDLALSKDPDTSNIEAFQCRVAAKMNLEEFNGVLDDINYLIKRRPDNYIYHFFKGCYYSHFSEFNKSLYELDFAIDSDSLNHTFMYARGKVHFHNGDMTNACKDWKKAYQLGNRDAMEMIQEHCK